MSNFTCYVGEQIRKYRKAGKMTLQDLADAIHKSRATVCKYENGDISVDIETLYEISQILQVSMSQLTTGLPETASKPSMHREKDKKAHFSGTAAIFLLLRWTLSAYEGWRHRYL